MLHDIGKLGVPTRLLQKSGGLTDAEFEAIQRHPVQGLEIVREIDFLDEANDGILHHHERIDGRGYPKGLVGDEIPEFARVIAVADAFDSMTTTRSYRGARSIEEAVIELRRCAGTQFDPLDGRGAGACPGRAPHGCPEAVTAVHATRRGGRSSTRTERTYDHDDPASNLIEEAGMSDLRRRLDDSGSMGSVVVIALRPHCLRWPPSPSRRVDFVQPGIAVAFGAFIACGELARITLPGGRDAAPIATAGALGYVLLTTLRETGDPPPVETQQSALQVVAVVVVAMLVGVAPHAVTRRAPSVDSMARRLLTIGVAAAVFRGTGLRVGRRQDRQPGAGVHPHRHRAGNPHRRRDPRGGGAGRRRRRTASGPTCATSCRPRWASARPSAPPAR